LFTSTENSFSGQNNFFKSTTFYISTVPLFPASPHYCIQGGQKYGNVGFEGISSLALQELDLLIDNELANDQQYL
jgi:hypothetical protein